MCWWNFNQLGERRLLVTREQASVTMEPVIFRNHDNFIRSFQLQILIILSSRIRCNFRMSISGIRLVTLQFFMFSRFPSQNCSIELENYKLHIYRILLLSDPTFACLFQVGHITMFHVFKISFPKLFNRTWKL